MFNKKQEAVLKMKKINFPLFMKENKPVNELEELQEYFDLKKAVEYFVNGKLQKWLENNYNDDLAEELSELTGEEEDFLEQFTDILGVEIADEDIDVSEIVEKANLKEKLKRYYPEDEVGKMVDSTASSQQQFDKLSKKGCQIIYLMPGEYTLPHGLKKCVLNGIDKVTVKIHERKDVAEITFENISPADEESQKAMEKLQEESENIDNQMNQMFNQLLGVLKAQLEKMEGESC